MSAFEYNFPNHINGDTFNGIQFEVKVNNTAINLTGATIAMQLRESIVGVNPIDFSTTNSKITIVDAVNGKFKINKQIVQAPICKTYLYDIQITLQNSDNYTYIKGSWNIVADITHNG